MEEEVEFTVTCKMNKRWVPTFMRMLGTMQSMGSAGHSEYVGMFADGDGDYKPFFESDVQFDGIQTKELKGTVSSKDLTEQCTMYSAD